MTTTYVRPARYSRKPVIPGAAIGTVNDTEKVLPCVNKIGIVKEKFLLTLPASPDNTQAYSVYVNDQTVTFTTDASATRAELQAGLIAAFTGTVTTIAAIAASGNDITIESVTLGTAISVSVNDSATTNDIVVTKSVNPSVEVWSIVLPATVDNSATYSFTVDEIPVSFTTDASATTAELLTGLVAAFNNHPQALGKANIVKGFDRFLLTGKTPFQTIAVTVTSNGTTTNDLTVTKEVAAAADSGLIKFGTFVVTHGLSDITGFAVKPPTSASETVLGIAGRTWASEQHGWFNSALVSSQTEGYPLNETIDVVTDTGANPGYFVRCIESTIGVNDTLYVSVAAETAGWVTTSSGGTIALSGATRAKVIVPAQYAPDYGIYCVGIEYTR